MKNAHLENMLRNWEYNKAAAKTPQQKAYAISQIREVKEQIKEWNRTHK